MNVKRTVFVVALCVAGLISVFASSLPRAQAADLDELATDNSLGLAHHQDRALVRASVLLADPLVQRHVQQIVDRLVRPVSELQYTVRILNDSLVNAYSPGPGYIYITSGLLDLVATDDELAFVIGHELAHGAHDHVVKSVRKSQTAGLAGVALGSFAQAVLGQYGEAGRQLGNQVGQGLAQLTQTLISKGYSRDLELEADGNSLAYMHGAGYDLDAALSLAAKMIVIRDELGLAETLDESLSLHFLNAEPGLEERVRQLEAGRTAVGSSAGARP
jgi:predicted Zn-dependent protease